MSAMSRTKGQAGEREIAALIRDLTGWDVRRRVRQHNGDTDLDGVPGWSVEVKRHREASRGDIATWWAQAAAQAEQAGAAPVLFFRVDRDAWRAVWPLAVQLVEQRAAMWSAYAWTVEGSVEAWAGVAREAASLTAADARQARQNAAGDASASLPGVGTPLGAPSALFEQEKCR
jgi:Holliday junction resolvase